MKDAATNPPPAYTARVRIKAILDELDRAADEYIENHKRNQEVQVHFKAARERFASIKRIASDMLSLNDWYEWQDRHGNVRYAATTIGEAIRDALRDRAFVSAAEVFHKYGADAARDLFAPGMTPEQLVDVLETGGFEFKGAPRRQIHAALLQLDGVTEKAGEYSIDDADEIFQMVVSMHEPETTDSTATNGSGE